MIRAPLVMGVVAATSGLGGLFVFTRPARSEGAVYGRRILGTMLLGLALLLGSFALAFHVSGVAG